MDDSMVNDEHGAPLVDGDQPARATISAQDETTQTYTDNNNQEQPALPQKQTDIPSDSYKNPDGSFDMDRILKDLAGERERADGLRKKLTDASKKSAPFQATDLAVQVPDDERAAMDDIVKSFNEYGISKDQADKILGKFAAMVPSDDDQRKDADARYQEEMNKLGSERNKILADLRSFTDTMLANKIWDDGQKKIFYDAVTSADAAKMFHSAIENFKVLGAGVFSSTQPAQHPAASQRTSQQESIDLYRRAFQLAKTNPLDGELELKKLDKLLGLK